MISIVYWSQTGNTQAMAEAISEGVTEAGKEAKIIDVTDASLDALKTESEMEHFVSELEGSVGGKTIALFGSYGWGDGQWMRDWVERMEAAGARVLNGEGLICQEVPNDDAIAECKALGKQLAAQ